jgi:protein involved in temperature-dependent protein secretion
MSERSLEEIRAAVRAFRREIRDEELRQGKRRPNTQREIEIWLAGTRERFGLRQDDDGEAQDDR